MQKSVVFGRRTVSFICRSIIKNRTQSNYRLIAKPRFSLHERRAAAGGNELLREGRERERDINELKNDTL